MNLSSAYQLSTKRDRHASLDWCRFLAILLVILDHVIPPPYGINTGNNMDFIGNLFLVIAFTISAQGVPLFFFLSGYLLLDRLNTKEDVLRFYRKNLLHLFIAAELVFILIFAFEAVYTGAIPEGMRIIKALCFCSSGPNATCWYIRAILAIYALMPVMWFVAKRMSMKWLWILTVVILGATISWKTIADIINLNGGSVPYFPHEIHLVFRGMCYLFYILLGYMLKKLSMKKPSTLLLISAYILPTLAAAAIQQALYYSGQLSVLCSIWYDSPFIVTSSASLFLLVTKHMTKHCHFVERSAIYSFGIYLLHYPVLVVIKDLICKPTLLTTPMVLSLTFIISWLLVFGINKIPKVGIILFLIRPVNKQA